MKKFTKTLSIVLLVAMCVSMFTISSFAANAECTAQLDAGGCPGHIDPTLHPAVAPDCKTQKNGHVAYYKCDKCDACYADAAGTVRLTSDTFTIPYEHTWIDVAEVPADCVNNGMKAHKKCDVCGVLNDNVANLTIESDPEAHVWGNWAVEKEPTTTEAGLEARYCSICEKSETNELEKLTVENVPFSVSGTTPAEFNANSTYTYYVDHPELHELLYVKIDGKTLYEGFSYVPASGKITLYGAEIAGFVGSKTSVPVVFVGANKGDENAAEQSYGGFTLNNATTVATLRVDGFEQKGFLLHSTESVYFTTNDPNPGNVKLYSVRTGKYIDVTDFDFDPLGGGEYTYTFNKAFLDELEAGTYYARAFYGDGKYVSVGTIIISVSEQTKGTPSLSFSNSSVSTTEYKYVSGGLRPELYCELFRDSDAILQISNDGYSWKNVSVYDYYIEQSNGDDTPYAWIKTTLLDNQKASSNVYFRVIVPASERGAKVDAVSNWVKVTTGNNIKAIDTDKHVINSSKSLKFVASVPVDVVKVGSIALEEGEDFSFSKDHKTITLFADFLNKRTAGSTYTLTAITDDGEELKTTFKILTTAQASASPRTGDDSNIALWSALVLMSGAAVVAVLPRLKKER